MTNWNQELDRAREYAVAAHADQKYGDLPYVVHLDAVHDVLTRFGFDPEAADDQQRVDARDILRAAYLHDTIEDTPKTRQDVAEVFGNRVALLAWSVSYEEGANRNERAERTYPKIRATPLAVALKLGDRIANVEASLENNPRLLAMYRKEHDKFAAALRTEGLWDEMWRHLDGLLDT